MGMGDCMLGLNDERRETVPAGVPDRGASPRREDVDDFRPRAGVEERKLATLGLRCSVVAALKLGVEGVRRGCLGEFSAGDGGSGELVAVGACSERRFSGCEGSVASLFVDRAGRGAPEPAAAGLDCRWFCILALGGRVAALFPPRHYQQHVRRVCLVVKEATHAMTVRRTGRVRLVCNPNWVPLKRAPSTTASRAAGVAT